MVVCVVYFIVTALGAVPCPFALYVNVAVFSVAVDVIASLALTLNVPDAPLIVVLPCFNTGLSYPVFAVK